MTKLSLNGKTVDVSGPGHMPLLWAIRDVAGMTGTKYGCGVGTCGACTVHVNGKAEFSCQLTVDDVADAEITTIEGLDSAGDHPVQVAWRDQNVPQCGFCQAGQIMKAAALLAENPKPSDEEIYNAMSNNICRCGCYQRIVDAVRLASTGI